MLRPRCLWGQSLIINWITSISLARKPRAKLPCYTLRLWTRANGWIIDLSRCIEKLRESITLFWATLSQSVHRGCRVWSFTYQMRWIQTFFRIRFVCLFSSIFNNKFPAHFVSPRECIVLNRSARLMGHRERNARRSATRNNGANMLVRSVYAADGIAYARLGKRYVLRGLHIASKSRAWCSWQTSVLSEIKSVCQKKLRRTIGNEANRSRVCIYFRFVVCVTSIMSSLGER